MNRVPYHLIKACILILMAGQHPTIYLTSLLLLNISISNVFASLNNERNIFVHMSLSIYSFIFLEWISGM